MSAIKLPLPRAEWGGCLWLPRIIAKARALAAGQLPPDYAARFCHPGGVDGQFLDFFQLTRADIETAANRSDAEVLAWFTARFPAGRIQAWNHIANNLGRPGFPLEQRFPVAMSTVYAHLANRGFDNILDVLTADETT